MVVNQMSHQESGIANGEHITSNPGPLHSKPVLWFQLSLGDLIIITFIMVMLSSILKL